MSDQVQAMEEFKQGIQLLRSDYQGKALVHVRQAVELDKKNPLYVSYLGLLVGLVQHKHAEGEQLCQQAIRMRHNEPRLYLNLAEVYLKAGKKADAVETLTQGLLYTKQDPRLREALRKLGVRRSPVIGVFHRGHFLNKQLGRLRHRLLGRWMSA
jgi:Flp pilus assembly protein TadD